MCPGFDSGTGRHIQYVGWVYWFFTLFREVFLQVLRFSPLPQKPTFNLIWFDIFDLFDLMIWFDLFSLQSPQLVKHSCSARMNWDLNKVIIIIAGCKRWKMLFLSNFGNLYRKLNYKRLSTHDRYHWWWPTGRQSSRPSYRIKFPGLGPDRINLMGAEDIARPLRLRNIVTHRCFAQK